MGTRETFLRTRESQESESPPLANRRLSHAVIINSADKTITSAFKLSKFEHINNVFQNVCYLIYIEYNKCRQNYTKGRAKDKGKEAATMQTRDRHISL